MEKSRWDYEQRSRDMRDGTTLSFERDLAYGFSWPQRNYRCSFCKKEFKSAQALGGHMNVHRRDRARMRLSPNPNPNPNPSLPLSSHLPPSTPKFLPCNLACISVANPPSPPSSLQEDKLAALCREDLEKRKKNEGKMVEINTNFARRNDVIRLDLSLSLGLGLIQDAKEDSGSDLDLELRLGCS